MLWRALFALKLCILIEIEGMCFCGLCVWYFQRVVVSQKSLRLVYILTRRRPLIKMQKSKREELILVRLSTTRLRQVFLV